ncbi:MAG: hypothetical protein WCC87_03750 [Candidatus Korobacteraceae bacterium]
MKAYARISCSPMFLVGTLMLCVITGTAQSQPSPQMTARQASRFAVSAPMRDLAGLPPQMQYGFQEVDQIRKPGAMPTQYMYDPVQQDFPGHSAATIVPGLSVEGINDICLCAPPDTNASVGDTQIVEWVNEDFAVYDKSTGALLLGPLPGNSLFTNLGGDCATQDNADPIAQFDKTAHRWLMAVNLLLRPPYAACVAVSTSPDATGTYYLYQFPLNGYPDYPKWGIWPTGYFQTQNTGGLSSANVCAYNSTKMLVGDSTAEQICEQLSSSDFSLMPADLDSATQPPVGQDEFFIGSYNQDSSFNHLYLYSMHPVFSNPSETVFIGNGLADPITVPTYTPICNASYGLCITQPGTGRTLEALGDRLMYRLAYWEDQPLVNVRATPPRPLPSQHWFVNHIVAGSSGQVAERWYEFTAPIKKVDLTGVSLFQSGTFAPDNNNRWMGSIARDKVGNVALGYSIGSASMYASIAVAGRSPGDPLGQLGGEVQLTTGTGAQTGLAGRWGDYSDMVVDPGNPCILWYLQEYLTTTGSADWQTRMNQIRFSSCQ